jgi:hypothetical protein
MRRSALRYALWDQRSGAPETLATVGWNRFGERASSGLPKGSCGLLLPRATMRRMYLGGISWRAWWRYIAGPVLWALLAVCVTQLGPARGRRT